MIHARNIYMQAIQERILCHVLGRSPRHHHNTRSIHILEHDMHGSTKLHFLKFVPNKYQGLIKITIFVEPHNVHVYTRKLTKITTIKGNKQASRCAFLRAETFFILLQIFKTSFRGKNCRYIQGVIRICYKPNQRILHNRMYKENELDLKCEFYDKYIS